ncbi:DUF892 family protein [Saccharibacter floricola]|uniref:DUF892 family protein n=1 Tax=Saccharibacter floricola DSM 15669 TaxID=1123227 RepID=A0ABQ0NWI6_9PROT|nr:DUF892 family protein [Saccharibacter floricola]GBQ05120.1 hypothetical protein AA15669_0312 [Saccharibacter floricola DSM 15669]
MPNRHALTETYIDHLHAHTLLTESLRENLLEALSRPEAPKTLQQWITTILEQNRQQARHINRMLRQHGEKPRDDHDTVSSMLDTMVSCLPPGQTPHHLLGVVLNLAGAIARQRTSLALLRLLAEKQGLDRETQTLSELRQMSKNASRDLKEVLPSLLDELES